MHIGRNVSKEFQAQVYNPEQTVESDVVAITPSERVAFGVWGDRAIDGLSYQTAIRFER
jgi:hypothetical protein